MNSLTPTALTGKLVEGAHVHRNLSTPQLVEAAIARGEASLADNGALVALTGARTGRSPRDKFIVRDALTSDTVDWGKVNQPFDSAKFEALLERVTAHMRERDLYVLDLLAGADEDYRLPVQIIAEYAWHALFVKQLFVRVPAEELASHKPEFTVIAAPEFEAVPERDGTHSSTFIITDFTRRIILIGGTKYAGEMKKSIFGVMNFLLPARDVFPMHCSANLGKAETLRCSSDFPAPAKPPSPPIRSDASSETMSTAGVKVASSTSRVAATPNASICRRRRNRRSTMRSASVRCSRM